MTNAGLDFHYSFYFTFFILDWCPKPSHTYAGVTALPFPPAYVCRFLRKHGVKHKWKALDLCFPFFSWTHELGIPAISKSTASSSSSWQVQTTTMCISVSLSGSVVLGCLFAPKVHIILFQPQKNVASLRVTASRFSATVSASASAPGSSYSKGTSFPHSQCVAAIRNYLVIVFSCHKRNGVVWKPLTEWLIPIYMENWTWGQVGFLPVFQKH